MFSLACEPVCSLRDQTMPLVGIEPVRSGCHCLLSLLVVPASYRGFKCLLIVPTYCPYLLSLLIVPTYCPYLLSLLIVPASYRGFKCLLVVPTCCPYLLSLLVVPTCCPYLLALGASLVGSNPTACTHFCSSLPSYFL